MACAGCALQETACPFCTVKHVRRSGFPGHSLCGLNSFQYPALRFAPRGTATSNCGACHATVARHTEIHAVKGPKVLAARQKEREEKALHRRPRE